MTHPTVLPIRALAMDRAHLRADRGCVDRASPRGCPPDFGRAAKLRPQLNASIVHVPYPYRGDRLDTKNVDMRSGAAVFAVQGPPRPVPVAQVVASRTAALTLVEASVALWWVARSVARPPARDARHVMTDLESPTPTSMVLARCSTEHRVGSFRRRAACHPLLGRLPLAFPGAATSFCPAAADLRPDAVDLARRTSANGPTRFPSGATAAFATPICRPRADPKTKTSRSPESAGRASPTPSGMLGQRFLTDHVAVLERRQTSRGHQTMPISADVRGGLKNTRIAR